MESGCGALNWKREIFWRLEEIKFLEKLISSDPITDTESAASNIRGRKLARLLHRKVLDIPRIVKMLTRETAHSRKPFYFETTPQTARKDARLIEYACDFVVLTRKACGVKIKRGPARLNYSLAVKLYDVCRCAQESKIELNEIYDFLSKDGELDIFFRTKLDTESEGPRIERRTQAAFYIPYPSNNADWLKYYVQMLQRTIAARDQGAVPSKLTAGERASVEGTRISPCIDGVVESMQRLARQQGVSDGNGAEMVGF